MKKAFLFLLPIISLAACSNAAQEEGTYVVDSVNRKVLVKKGSYRRIVCIGAGALRLYSYIGDVSLLSGVEDIDNSSLSNRPKMFDNVARPYFIVNEASFSSLPSCGTGGPNAQSAEAEKILSCSPDLVISEYEDADKADALQEKLGVPVITLGYGSNGVFDEKIKYSLALLGDVLGKESKASSLISYIDKEKQEIFTRTEKVKEEDKPSVYICGLGNWGTTNHLMSAQNYEPFNVAHIKNALDDMKIDGIQKITKEKFASIGEKADKIIIDAAAIKNIIPLFAEDRDLFESTKAWASGEVYLEMAYNAYYTNLEIALANTWYSAKVVYPSLFKDIDIVSKTNEITNAFLGKELYEQIASYPSSFGGYQKIDVKEFFK
jgi:iron complex transport system substrate-binding protein